MDLFASYGLTQKAIGLLEAILRRAPMHTPTLEKLLDFVLGAGDDRRTAELAAQLEHIHGSRGDGRSSEQFGELRRRFQRAAGLSDEEIATAVAAAMPQAVETHPVPRRKRFQLPRYRWKRWRKPPRKLPKCRWKQRLSKRLLFPKRLWSRRNRGSAEPGSGNSRCTSGAEGRRSQYLRRVGHVAGRDQGTCTGRGGRDFRGACSGCRSAQEEDLAASFLEQAISCTEASEKPPSKPVPADLPEFEIFEETSAAPPAASPFAEISAELPLPEPEPASAPVPQAHIAEPDEMPETLLPEEELTALPVPEHAEVASEGPEPSLDIPQPAVVEKSATEPEFELDQDFELVLEPETIVPPHEMLAQMPPPPVHEVKLEPRAEKAPAETVAAASTGSKEFSTDDFLSDLAKEMGELGLGELTQPVAHAPVEEIKPAVNASARNATAMGANGEAGPLKDVFDEFRADMDDLGTNGEDLETHYNLGTAYREMGLLDEAISEFQKVAKANKKGEAFRYAMNAAPCWASRSWKRASRPSPPCGTNALWKSRGRSGIHSRSAV